MRGWFNVYRFVGVLAVAFGLIRFVVLFSKSKMNATSAIAVALFIAMYDVMNMAKKDATTNMAMHWIRNGAHLELQLQNHQWGRKIIYVPKNNVSFIQRGPQSYTEVHLKDGSVFRGSCQEDQFQLVLQQHQL